MNYNVNLNVDFNFFDLDFTFFFNIIKKYSTLNSNKYISLNNVIEICISCILWP